MLCFARPKSDTSPESHQEPSGSILGSQLKADVRFGRQSRCRFREKRSWSLLERSSGNEEAAPSHCRSRWTRKRHAQAGDGARGRERCRVATSRATVAASARARLLSLPASRFVGSSGSLVSPSLALVVPRCDLRPSPPYRRWIRSGRRGVAAGGC